MLVATQLPRQMKEALEGRLATVELLTLPAGPLTAFPEGISVFIPAALDEDGQSGMHHRPDGWPFNIRWVHLISAGLDLYPDWIFEVERVTFSPGSSAVALAEYALAAILAVIKDFPNFWICRRDDWHLRTVKPVFGSQLGIVGFGQIGEELAVRALTLGMGVRALRFSNRPMMEGVERVTNIGDLMICSDHVVLALPANSTTVGMIDREILSKAKPGLHLVNVARGSLIDDNALLEALDEGRLSYATLDVTNPEPLPSGHPFYNHPKVRLSPHTAGASSTTIQALADIFAENVRRFESGEPLLNLAGRASD